MLAQICTGSKMIKPQTNYSFLKFEPPIIGMYQKNMMVFVLFGMEKIYIAVKKYLLMYQIF